MIMGYLLRLEQLQLQGLDTWWYDKGVKRVQMYFVLLKTFYFTDNEDEIVAIGCTGEWDRFFYRGTRKTSFKNYGWTSC